MKPERWRQIEQLYHAALEKDAGLRPHFLEQACASDLSLRREVESLLAQAGEDDRFLEEPALDVAAKQMAREPSTPIDAGMVESLSQMPTVTMGGAKSERSAVSLESLIGESVGNYRILSRLGGGGMGEVFLAHDAALERKVALKLLPPDYAKDTSRVRRFTQEAKAASALNHPNIVSIYAFGESEFGHYIAMELIEGLSLRAIGALPLPPAQIRDIGGQVARALDVTHAAGLIHRDIKPDNIMIRPDGLVKVLDFGLVRFAEPMARLAETGSSTVPGAILGTVMYMSPEQGRGETVTSASDIFSLGIVLYQLATGHHPFHADTAVGYLHSILSHQPIPPSRLNPEVPVWLETIVLRMLQKEPEQRCTASALVAACQPQDSPSQTNVAGPAAPPRRTIAREKERAELNAALESAVAGKSSMVCVSGEPGQGKTTLVEEFLLDLSYEGQALVAQGRCSERLGAAEAYLPVLEVLDSLLNGEEREKAATAMKSLAPSWYAQLVPSTVASPDPGGPSSEKLKRELANFFLEVSRQQPLVVFLDDVHWADASTVDLLAYLGTKLDRIRMLIVVSFRGPEMHSGNHQFIGLQLDLMARGMCREIPLSPFTLAEIREYIDAKFPGNALPDDFVRMIHERTEGNPLFVADLLRYLQEKRAIRPAGEGWDLTQTVADMQVGLPESVRSMVQRKIEQLSEEERKLLTAASVQGYAFEAAVVAKALDADPAEVEERLEKLERTSGFVKMMEEHEYADRQITQRFRFVHVFYQNAFYASLRPARRTSLSRLVAQALLQFHGDQVGKIATQVAFLFDAAREFEQAAVHYQTAAQHALLLFASGEARTLAQKGVEALRSLPEGEARARQELGLQKILGAAFRNLKSHSGHEAVATHRRLMELAEQLNDYHTLFAVHYGLAWSFNTHQEFDKALTESSHCLRIAEKFDNAAMLAAGHVVYGDVLTHQGRLVESRQHLESAISLYDPAKAVFYARLVGSDPSAHANAVLGITLSFLGYPDQGLACLREAADVALRAGNPIAQGVVQICNILSFSHFRDQQSLRKASDDLTDICLKNEFQASMLHFAKFGHGWATALAGDAAAGLAKIDEAIADVRAIGSVYAIPMLAHGKAEVMRQTGRHNELLLFLDEQLEIVEKKGQWIEVPQLFHTKGECLLEAGDDYAGSVERAEDCFLRAIEVARRIEAKLLELEAATSLASLYRSSHRPAEAFALLSGVYGWFTEGFATLPLTRAKALLEELAK